MRYLSVLLLLSLNAAAAGAQSSALRIVTPDGEKTFAATSVGSTPRFDVRALQALGAGISTRSAVTTVVLFSDTLRFTTGSPFFRIGRTVYQLAHPPMETGSVFAIPEQFFISWLPRQYEQVSYAGGAVRLAGQPRVAQPAISSGTGLPAQAATSNPTPRDTARARRIVVLDPGHGGIDPGSSGPNGLREKDVTLQIANRLAVLLRGRGYQVYLTRSRDTLISLADRPAFANRWKGDEPGALYVSIHTNSFKVASASGFETFFLSEASTDDERRVAEMENSSVKYEAKSSAPGKELDQVLNSLSNDFYLRASNDFAGVIQKRLGAFHPGTDRGVKRAPFRVLVGALMPAVLIEVGFITNPQEAQLLGTAGFQDKLSWSIADSIDSFFRDNEHLWVRVP